MTAWPCEASEAGLAGNTAPRLPIGRPLPVAEILLLDAAFQPVPLGASGELCIGGVCLARGYLGRPELTAEKFVPHPFAGSDRPGARLYRSGDFARHRTDGAIEFLGRIDGQVKVRGFRVELGEIEAALREHPAVREAVVVDRADPATGSRRLVAWLVPRPGTAGSPREIAEEVQGYLRARLPGYMVPASFVPLEALPLTPSGKVDRQALPEPERARPEGSDEEPRGPFEELLAEIWSGLLGVSRVGRKDSFFDLGGHSLLATQLVSRVRETVGVELPVRRIFEAPTLAGFARQVEEARSRGELPAVPPVRPVPRGTGELPLSFAQERLWFLDQLEPGSPAYVMPAAILLAGRLDPPSLAASLAEIVRRHEALRTTFGTVSGRPRQVVARRSSLALPAIDLGSLPVARRRPEVERWARAEARRPFDLARGPLLRVVLLRLAAEEHVVLFAMHHIVSDGWSMGILVRELGAIYAAIAAGVGGVAGRPSPLPELPVQYADFALWQRGWLTGEILAAEIAWWRHRLSGVPVLELPTDRPRPAAQSAAGAGVGATLPREVAAALREQSRRRGVTPFMLLLAGFAALLSRYTGQDDVAVGSPIANRTRLETEGLIGFFVNTLVLRTDLSGNPSFADLTVRVRESTLAAHAHQDLPFERLVEELAPERSLSYTPLFQVMLLFQPGVLGDLRLPGLDLHPLPIPSSVARFDLLLQATPEDDELRLFLEYRRELFEPTTATRLLTHLGNLLLGAATDPSRRLAALPLLSAAEREQVLRQWNDTRAAVQPVRVQEIFEAQAERQPWAPAVEMAGEVWLYGELESRANRLARHLQALGVGFESAVGICLERSLALPMAVLAVLKAGGAYVALDPTYPTERLEGMAGNAGLAALVTATPLLDRLPPSLLAVPLVLLDRAAANGIAGEDETRPACPAAVDNLAYILYTSGSTGRPKGIAMPHRPLANMVAWQLRATAPGLRTLQFASLAFDVSFQEMFTAWGSGGCVVLLADEVRRDAVALFRFLASERIERLFLPFVALQQLAETPETPGAPENAALPPLREVMAAGEQLRVTDPVRRLFLRLPGSRLENHYGPSEAHAVTAFTLLAPAAGWPDLPPIGRPIPNHRVLLLDRLSPVPGEPVPPGVLGEIYVGGAGLSRGYLGRPDLTAERFLPDPWGGEAGARLYRTGDLARFRTSGLLDYLGRVDQQVKVRGFRVEPGEVEAVLAAYPGVRAAAVLAVPGKGSAGVRLVAYVVAEGVSGGELRAFLAERLPDYMVPSAFVALADLPLTPSGKLDRRSLARFEPAAELPGGGEGPPPRSAVEILLAGIWSEILGVEGIGTADNFFELGGHSLLATQVLARVRQVLEVEIAVKRLFETPTLGGLAEAIEEALAAGPAQRVRAAPILALARPETELPLSFAQERLWFLDQLEPGSAAYNLGSALRLAGQLDVPALAASLGEIVRRHAVLRTTFRTVDGRPVQVIAPVSALLPRVDLSALPGEEREAELRRLVREEVRRAFDLLRGPLLRATLVRLAADEHALLFFLHHIVSDGWSTGILVRELGALYGSFLAGWPSPLRELPFQYADFAVWQRGHLTGAVLEAELAYWREALADLSPLDLPTDRPRPAVRRGRGGRCHLQLSPESSGALARLSRRTSGTLFMTLLSGLAALLSRMTGQDDFAVGTPVANRNRAEIEGLIGFFVNTLVLRLRSAGDPAWSDLLAAVRRTALAAYAHQNLPFEQIVEELAPERDPGRTPLFQVMLALQNLDIGTLALPGLLLEPIPMTAETAKFDLLLTLAEEPSGILGLWEYDRDLFDAPTIERLSRHFAVLLDGAAQSSGARLSELPLLAAAERQQLVREWSDERSEYPRESPLPALFAAQAAATPDAVALDGALDDGAAALSYGELGRRANRLAYRLAALGVGPEVRVGLCLERSFDWLVAALGILGAGGAYVPLDPSYPRERLALLASGAAVLVTVERWLPRLPPGPRIYCLDQEAAAPGSAAAAATAATAVAPESGATADSPCYVLYTSGSTGLPKGVVVPHRGVVRLVRGTGYVHFGPGEVFLQLSPLSFDASTFEIWGALLHGGRLVLAPPQELSLADLGAILARHEVTTLWLTAGLFHQMVDLHLAGLRPVRQLLAGGDVLSVAHARRVLAELPETTLVNGYGPTESTTFASSFPVRSQEDLERSVPLGRPIANTEIHLVDRALGPVPIGVAGEVAIGGDGLARGYLDRPDLTAERFVPNPFGGWGSRLYRTGDLARFSTAGRIEILGRLDAQAKVRGFRVEPGEIETVLGRHPAVQEVVVTVREERPGDRRLVAYVVPLQEVAGLPAGLPTILRAYAAESLPAYLVPAAFVVLSALPLSAHGKVDRGALPVPEWAGAGEHVAPRTALEEVLVGLWQQVLGREKVGVTDDFFLLGGHSLLATQLISRVRATFQVELALRRLFEAPTVETLAAAILAAEPEPGQSEKIARALLRLGSGRRHGG